MQRFQLPVSITAIDGRAGSQGEVEFVRPPLRRRLRKAGLLFLAGVAGGMLLLPIPLVHIAGLAFFLTLTGLAGRRLLSREILKAASGHCPACGAAGEYFVGFGGRRLAFPIVTSCPHCTIELTLGLTTPPTVASPRA